MQNRTVQKGEDLFLYHVACPFTGEAQCYCPQGHYQSLGDQSDMLPVASVKQLYDTWRERIPHLAKGTAVHSKPAATTFPGSTEILMPRLYRNQKSMEANNDLPVKAGGEMISKNQAVTRLSKALSDAKALAKHAAELAHAAGQSYQPPADLGLEMPALNNYNDLEILKKIASGAIVQLAEQGRLSDLEEQQLLGLTADEYCALRGMQVPGSTKLSHGSQTRASQSVLRTNDDATPEDNLINTLRMKEINSSLRGQKLLVKLPQMNSWQQTVVHDLDLKTKTAKLGFSGTSSVIDVDLTEAIRDGVLAWDGERPADRSSEGGDAETAAGPSYPATLDAPQSSAGPRPHHTSQQQIAAMLHHKQQQIHNDYEGQHKKGQLAHQQQHASMQVAYDNSSMNNSSGIQQLQHRGEQYQQRPVYNTGSVMEVLLNMRQQAVGLQVEVHSQASQHSRKGIIAMVFPQQQTVVVQFGGMSAPLKACEEFRSFTIQVVR